MKVGSKVKFIAPAFGAGEIDPNKVYVVSEYHCKEQFGYVRSDFVQLDGIYMSYPVSVLEEIE